MDTNYQRKFYTFSPWTQGPLWTQILKRISKLFHFGHQGHFGHKTSKKISHFFTLDTGATLDTNSKKISHFFTLDTTATLDTISQKIFLFFNLDTKDTLDTDFRKICVQSVPSVQREKVWKFFLEFVSKVALVSRVKKCKIFFENLCPK